MAQYWEDWSGSTIGQEPTGWTKRWDLNFVTYEVKEDAEAPAGRKLEIGRGASSARNALSFDAVDSDANRAGASVRALVRLVGTLHGTGATYGGVLARGKNGLASATGALSLLGSSGSDRQLRAYRLLSGASSYDVASTVNAWSLDAICWIGIDFDGDVQTSTIAPANDPDNPIATIESTATATDAGWVGVFANSAALRIDVLAIGIGTNGDPAPTSAPSGATNELQGAATVSVNASADLTTAPANATKGVREQLGDGTTPESSLTGLSVRWWDNETATGAPDYEANDETTDASGWLEINLDAVTSLDVDDYGYLLVLKNGASTDNDIVAGGRVQIKDIAS